MDHLQLFRKRLIPYECLPLKDDIIIFQSDDYIVTSWTTLNPKIAFHRGCSCYFLQEGLKLSKFYKHDGSLLYWYCDIVEYEWSEDRCCLTATDLLADVIIYPDGQVKILDLDELADAHAAGLITSKQLQTALYRLNTLLNYIYNHQFHILQETLESRGL